MMRMKQFLVSFWFPLCRLTTASELVLKGYSIEQVSVDTSPYLGIDGVSIHPGDHLHDPCTEHVGQRFTLASGGGSDDGRGFIVVNDCQVVECTKWNTAEGNNKNGGKTITYNLVPQQVESVVTWNILESSQCSCSNDNNNNNNIDGSQDCYYGKFLVVDQYDDTNCEVNDTPGSIDCVTGEILQPEPTPSVRSDILENETFRFGLLAAAALLALLCCCCCCGVGCFLCRRRRSKTDNDSDATDGTDVEAASPKSNQNKEETKTDRTGKRSWMLFGRTKETNDATENVMESDTSARKPRSAMKIGEPKMTDSASKGTSWTFGWGKNRKETPKEETQAPPPEPPAQKSAGWFHWNKQTNQAASEEAPPPVKVCDATAESSKKSWFGKKNEAESQKTAKMANISPSPSSDIDQLSSQSSKKSNKRTKQTKVENIEEEDQGVDCTCCGM